MNIIQPLNYTEFKEIVNSELIGNILLRSDTEEEYTELDQLCEDISTYKRNIAELKSQQKEAKKKKEEEDRRKADDVRKTAVERLAS